MSSGADEPQERIIVCFGDSNTWGFVPGGQGARFGRDKRWPCVLQKHLGPGHYVLEEGLSGRTTVLDDPLKPHRNGRDYLIPCLASHQPIDLLIIFLGTNDLADRYAFPPLDIARGAASLAMLARTSGAGRGGGAPLVLLVCPPKLGDIETLRDVMSGAPTRAAELPRCFRQAAEEAGVPLLDLSEVVAFSDVDGIHLDEAGHRVVAGEMLATINALGVWP